MDEFEDEWAEVDEVTGKPKNSKDEGNTRFNLGEKIGCSLVAVLVLGLIALVVFGSQAGCSRALKTFQSNANNGLDRTFTVYDYNGNKVFEDSGKLDYVYSDGKWYYDKDGKRTSTSGGIVIVQEQ